MKSLSICMWNIQGLKYSTFGLKKLAPEFIANLIDIDTMVRKHGVKLILLPTVPTIIEEL